MASAASEIVASVVACAVEYLDARPTRVCALNVPTPFSPVLERAVLPDTIRMVKAIREQDRSTAALTKTDIQTMERWHTLANCF
jgi:pyruvate/2-oxoglutarate/acetoin dehydrogenase E1 component